MFKSSIYHMTLKYLKNHIFGMKTSRFCHLLCSFIMDVITKHKNLYRFYCMALYHSGATSCDTSFFLDTEAYISASSGRRPE